MKLIENIKLASFFYKLKTELLKNKTFHDDIDFKVNGYSSNEGAILELFLKSNVHTETFYILLSKIVSQAVILYKSSDKSMETFSGKQFIQSTAIELLQDFKSVQNS